MVNLEKLNSTINDLEIRSKEIQSLVDKQKMFEILAKEIETLRNDVISDRKIVSDITKELNTLIFDSQNKLIESENIIDKRFSVIKEVLNDNTNLVNTSLGDLKTNIVQESAKYINNISLLEKEFNKSLDKINELNDIVIKKLNEVMVENNKAINNYHNIINTQVNLLKSDIQLQFRFIDESLNAKINSENKKIINIIEILESKVIEFNTKRIKSEKSIKIFLLVTSILSCISVILILIK